MKTKSYNFIYESVFAKDLTEYVALKRAIGYWFHTEASNLRRFDKLCIKINVEKPILTEDLINLWIAPRKDESVNTRIARVTALHGFVEHLNSKGQSIKWPLLRSHFPKQQFTPYIFTKEEIKQIFICADNLPIPSRGSQFHIVFPTVLRILYGTGLRISEALALKCEDVDIKGGFLTIRNSKFDNSRRLPISESLKKSLIIYEMRIKRSNKSIYFFENLKGEMYSQRSIYDKFRELLWKAGINHGGVRKGPRVHDFRHTFAVHALQKCDALNMDTYTFLPTLASYLGHKKVTTTEKYLRLTADVYPSLIDKASNYTNVVVPEVVEYE